MRGAFEERVLATFGFQSEHAKAYEELLDLYGACELLPDGRDEPLLSICPKCHPCWDDRRNMAPQQLDRAGVSAPFIGRRFFERRILVVAMNFNDWGGLDGNWLMCHWHAEAQARGELGKDGRWFGYGAMAYARLVEASLDGELPADWKHPQPRDLVGVWDNCALVQSVKCAPNSPHSNPFEEMFVECGRLLLLDELRILKPRVIIVLGRGPNPRDAIRPLLNVTYGEHPGHLERDDFELDGIRGELSSCNHPSSPTWRESLVQLHQSLAEHPALT